MTEASNRTPSQRQRAADLRGMAQLAVQSTLGVASIAEGVHQSVWRTLGVPGSASHPDAALVGDDARVTGRTWAGTAIS